MDKVWIYVFCQASPISNASDVVSVVYWLSVAALYTNTRYVTMTFLVAGRERKAGDIFIITNTQFSLLPRDHSIAWTLYITTSFLRQNYFIVQYRRTHGRRFIHSCESGSGSENPMLKRFFLEETELYRHAPMPSYILPEIMYEQRLIWLYCKKFQHP